MKREYSRSKIVLLAGTALVALMFVFPPWEYHDSDTSSSRSAGYHLFFNPPDPRTAAFRHQVRFPERLIVRKSLIRLILQLFTVIPAILGLAIVVRTNRSVFTFFIGFLFLLPAVLAFGLVAWAVVGNGLETGNWTLR